MPQGRYVHMHLFAPLTTYVLPNKQTQLKERTHNFLNKHRPLIEQTLPAYLLLVIDMSVVSGKDRRFPTIGENRPLVTDELVEFEK